MDVHSILKDNNDTSVMYDKINSISRIREATLTYGLTDSKSNGVIVTDDRNDLYTWH